MANFELSIISFSEKARLAMKIDMVNPMPANIDAPLRVVSNHCLREV